MRLAPPTFRRQLVVTFKDGPSSNLPLVLGSALTGDPVDRLRRALFYRSASQARVLYFRSSTHLPTAQAGADVILDKESFSDKAITDMREDITIPPLLAHQEQGWQGVGLYPRGPSRNPGQRKRIRVISSTSRTDYRGSPFGTGGTRSTSSPCSSP